jgi:magnesium transporter
MTTMSDRATGTPLASDFAQTTLEASPSSRVSELIQRLRDGPVAASLIAVCDDGRLQGIVDAAMLLTAAPETMLSALSRPVAVAVRPGTKAERAAWLASHAHADIVAVVDERERLLGLIPAAKLLPLLVREHEQDLARLGGFLKGTLQARTASEERVHRRLWHRLPWLLIGLLGAVVSAQIVRMFEGRLAETVALAFFLPGIVYMADAVGTQTESVVIRGLSIGVSRTKIFRLEALTGAAIGVFLSLAIFPLALALTGEVQIAAIVSLALLCSASMATVTAVTLPSLMHRLDLDPAFGSGPLATVIQDILSITIYFSIAVSVLGQS